MIPISVHTYGVHRPIKGRVGVRTYMRTGVYVQVYADEVAQAARGASQDVGGTESAISGSGQEIGRAHV